MVKKAKKKVVKKKRILGGKKSRSPDLLYYKAQVGVLEQTIRSIELGKYMWQSTFDAIRDPVFIISSDYVIERANLAAAEHSECHVRDLIGKKCFSEFAGRAEICPGCPLKATLKNIPHNVWINGLVDERDFQVSSYPFVNKVDSSHSVVHHYRDVTEEKRLQRRLMQSDKMAAVGMLAGGVAHEINNPLGGILAFAQLAMSDAEKDSSVAADLKEIETAAIRCKKIVENLLDFSRQSKDTDRRSIKVADIIEGVLPLIKLKLKSSGVEITTDYESNVPRVFGNMNRLQQVVMNLLTNAAHAMPDGGTIMITIHFDKQSGEVVLSVADTGVGMPKEVLEKIFDPYFTTKSQGEGTGLGLAISYSIISEHGGRIEVKSEVGKGSFFTVFLPKEKQG